MSDARTFTVPDFGPNDLLTSDKIGERAVKVSLDNLSDVEVILLQALNDVSTSLCNISEQIKLLNARVEEAFETGLTTDDIL